MVKKEVQKSSDEFYTPKETSRDMPDLESGESAEQRRNQVGQGLKISTLE